MGYLTTITFKNDGLTDICKNPKEVIDKIHNAIASGNTIEFGVGSHCNCVKVQKTRHVSDFTMYVHAGNSVFEINPYSNDFKKLVSNNPDFAKEIIEEVQFYVDKCNEIINDNNTESLNKFGW